MIHRPRSKRDVPVEHRNLAMSGEERRRLKQQFRERETQGGRPWQLAPKRAGEPTRPKGPTRTVDGAAILKELISKGFSPATAAYMAATIADGDFAWRRYPA